MKVFQRRCVVLLLQLVAFPLGMSLPAGAQVVRHALSIGAETGPGLYFGEFNSLDYSNTFSPSIGYDQGLFLKYNISQNFTLGASVGLMRLSYDVYDFVRLRYSANFFGPLRTLNYPGTSIPVTQQNRIDVTKYLIFAQTHFQPTRQIVPFVTFGIGMINFEPTNDVGDELPTNVTGSYSKKGVILPLGGGVQYFFNDVFSLHLQGLFYIGSSDYLDGYAHYLEFENPGGPTVGPGQQETPSDYMASAMIGASFVIYQPERDEPAPPPPIAQNQPPSQQPGESPGEPQPSQPIAENSPTPADQRLADPELDSDGDGLGNAEETNRYLTDPFNPDSDGDNLSDGEEILRHNTSPNNPDTDGDGLSDGQEMIVYNTNPLAADSDRDGLEDGEEIRKYSTNPVKPDTDQDLLADGVEVTRTLSDPLNPDTDGDGIPDGLDDCPSLAGTAENRGCPPGAIPASMPERVQTEGPLAGLPEFVETNDRADFAGIYFRVNSDDFDMARPETARNLARMLDYVKQCDNIGVVVEGHSSSEGNPRWNQELSERRARRVRDWLLANGVSSRKLLGTIGYGSALPKVPEPSAGSANAALIDQIRRQNRRITVLVRRRCE